MMRGRFISKASMVARPVIVLPTIRPPSSLQSKDRSSVVSAGRRVASDAVFEDHFPSLGNASRCCTLGMRSTGSSVLLGRPAPEG